MLSELERLLTEVRERLEWAPGWITGLLLLALAALIAIAAHAAMLAVLRRTVPASQMFLRSLIERTRGPTLFALLIFAIAIATQAAPFAPELIATLTQLLLVAFTVLVGWIALVAIDLAADLYLLRYRIDVADNLLARKHLTQVRILERTAEVLVVVITAAAVLMTFESVRQYGVSIFASAGVAGIVVGLAARPVFSNLFAGIQIAMTQPIRIDDSVVVEGEWGWIEEITSTYVVIRIWDLRRLIVPLSYFIERPFQNWTRETAALLAPVMLYLDYSVPLGAVREKLDEILAESKLWDGKTKVVQVTDARPDTIEVRVLLSARNAGDAWNLRCDIREKLIEFLQAEHPQALPRQRSEMEVVKPVPIGQGRAGDGARQ